MCDCRNIDIGSYDNQVLLPRPQHMKGRKEGSSADFISVDACLKEEILALWSLGIRTTGCCCGHNKVEGYIGVIPEDVPKMQAIGYQVQYNPYRPEDISTFNTKTS